MALAEWLDAHNRRSSDVTKNYSHFSDNPFRSRDLRASKFSICMEQIERNLSDWQQRMITEIFIYSCDIVR